ncbi:MAG: GNAT family N-acetyltransferase [Anaerolineae bacterium]
MAFQAIETERLRLRLFRMGDVDDYYRLIYADPEVMRYLPGGAPRPHVKAVEAIAYFIGYQDLHGYSLWAVERRADGAFLGHCGLVLLPHGGGKVEIAYAIGRPYWGQGFTTEAAHATLRFGFERLELPAIYALAVPENTASTRVMEKIGMAYRGLTTEFYEGWELALYRADRETFRPAPGHYRLIEGD